jgi:flagellar biosynthesis/type III secretory pathway protein FliH
MKDYFDSLVEEKYKVQLEEAREKGREEAREKFLEKGREEVREKAREKSRNDTLVFVAKNLLNKGLSRELILDYLNVSQEWFDKFVKN